MTPLDRFGKFMIEQLRDNPLEFYELLVAGRWQTADRRELHAQLASLTGEQRDLVRRCIKDVLERTLHDFLFALGEGRHQGVNITVLIDGKDIAALSDGLQGEPYGDRGWIARFSQYPAA